MKPVLHITDFSSSVLGLDLHPVQSDVITEFWDGPYNYGIYCLGRRSGKTLMAQCGAAYAGTVMEPIYRQYLRRNEKYRIVCVANSEGQAGIILEGIVQLITDSPLSNMIVKKRDLYLELDNGVVYEGIPTSARASRGSACPLIILDELAFAVGGAEVNAGGEAIFKALSPSMAQFGDHGRLLALSSPGLQMGIFYNLFTDAEAVEEDGTKKNPNMYAVKLPTWEVNPGISKAFLEAEKKRDPIMFAVEFGANFISNSLGLVDSRIIDEAVNNIRVFGNPIKKYFGEYILSLDPAKGNKDDYTACMMHYEGERLVVDFWHEFEATARTTRITTKGAESVMQVDVKEVERWILTQHRKWGIKLAAMDQYASMSSIQNLQDKIDIVEFTWSLSSKTKAYSKVRDLFNAGMIELPPNKKGVEQLKNLTVIKRPNGTWTVTGGSKAAVDDYCAAFAAGVYVIGAPEMDADWIDDIVGS